MKWFLVILAAILMYLQYRYWFSEGGYRDLGRLNHQIEQQKAENARLVERNRLLAAEVLALKNEDAAIEERARTDLGMVKKGESFYMIVPQKKSAAEP